MGECQVTKRVIGIKSINAPLNKIGNHLLILFFAISMLAGIMPGTASAEWEPMVSDYTGTNRNYYGVWGSSSSDVFAVSAGGYIQHFNGTQWSYMAKPSTNDLKDIWGTASSDVFAVAAGGDVVHYNGTAWSAQTSNTANDLNGVWGASSSNVFAVGASGTVINYNGTSWSVMTSNTANSLEDVWGAAADNVIAVGASGTIINYNGSTWSAMTSGTTENLYGVWGSSASNVYAVGASGTILNYNGTSWSAVTYGVTTTLYHVWGSSASDVFAVGASGVVLHYDGTSWSSMYSEANNNTLYHVWGSGSSDVFAVGARNYILHYSTAIDTTAPTTTATPGTGTYYPINVKLNCIDGAGSGCWRTFYTTDGSTPTTTSTVYDFSDGVEISTTTTLKFFSVDNAGNAETVQSITYTIDNVPYWSRMTSEGSTPWGIWGTSDNDIFAVGGGGTILHFDGSGWGRMLWNPSGSITWNSHGIWNIWGSASTDGSGNGDDVFFVTNKGSIQHYNGTAWSEQDNTGSSLNGIWGSTSVDGSGNANDVFAVGASGAIRHYNGTAWSTMTSNTSNYLRGVWGSAYNDVFAIGASGTIMHYDGSTWSAMASGTDQTLWAVWGTSSSNVWAMGAGSVILHYDGTDWTPDYSLAAFTTVGSISFSRFDIQDIHGFSATDIYAGGSNSNVIHYDGTTWHTLTVDSDMYMSSANSIWGASTTSIVIAGNGGIYHYYDGADTAAPTTSVSPGDGTYYSFVAKFTCVDAALSGCAGTYYTTDGTTPTTSSSEPPWYGVEITQDTTLKYFSVDAAGNAETVQTNTYTLNNGWWRSLYSGSSDKLQDVWGSSSSDVFSVGNSGRITHWDGSALSEMTSNTSNNLLGVGGFDSSNVWAVGRSGTIVYYNGTTWATQTSGVTASLWGVYAPAADDVFVVGTSIMLHYDGTSWSTMSGAGGSAVWGSSSTDVFAVGQNGAIYHYDGTSWTDQRFDTSLELYGVWGLSSTNVYAVGGSGSSAGILLQYNGTSWNEVNIGATTPLTSIFGTSASDIWIFGYYIGLHYNGSEWVELSIDFGYAYGAWTDFTNAIFVVGGSANVEMFYTGSETDAPTTTASPAAGTYPASVQVALSCSDGVGSGCAGIYYTTDGSTPSTSSTLYVSGSPVAITKTTTLKYISVDNIGNTETANSGTYTITDGWWSEIPDATAGLTYYYGLWGTSSTDVFAAGQYGTIEHWDGSTWSAMTSGTTQSIMDVWGTGSSDVFAVVSSGAILHYDGISWSAMTSGTTNYLRAVWGTGSNEVFAAGNSGTILSYDGSSWNAMTSNTTKYLQSLWGSSASDIFAVGQSGTIMHYDGSTWSAMTSNTTTHLHGIWGTSSSNIYAVGDSGTILNYDGSSWSAVTLNFTGNIRDIWGISASNIYASAEDDTILHYDGTTWAPMVTGTTNKDFYGIWGSSSSDIFAVSRGLILHFYAGSGDTTAPTSTASIGTGTYFGATVELLCNDANGSGCVSTYYTIDGTTPTTSSTLYSDGINITTTTTLKFFSVDNLGNSESVNTATYTIYAQGWISMTSNNTETLYGIWGSSDNDIYAVGNGGIILHYDGSSWTPVPSGTGTLYGIWGSASNDIFVVGDLGLILHYDGTSWSSMASGLTTRLYAVWGSASNDVFAVGNYGTILHYNGTSWSAMTSGSTRALSGVWGSASNDVFAVGSSGTILHYDGSSWSAMTSTAVYGLESVWGSSASDVFAVGTNRNVYHYDGSTWSLQFSDGGNFYSVWGSSSSNVIAMGRYSSSDYVIAGYDGTYWSSMDWDVTTEEDIRGIWGASSSKIFAVGSNGTIVTIDSSTPVTTVSPVGGWYNSSQNVTLTCTDMDASCAGTYYTLDGTTPTASSTAYSSAITISTDTTLKFFSIDSASIGESVKTETYQFDTTAPATTPSVAGGSYTSFQSITLTCADSDSGCAATYYTTDGTTPTASSTAYSSAIAITANSTTLKFFSVDNAGNSEAINTEAYVIRETTAPITTASVPGGVFSSSQTITLTCGDGSGSGCAATYYTTGGTTPTASSTAYSTAITISINTALKFFSVDNYGNVESVNTETYLFLVAPTGLSSTVGRGRVNLSWNGVTGFESSTNKGYRIYYGTTSGSLTSNVDAGDRLRGAVTGLTNGTTYYFAVKFYVGTSESGPSSEISAIPSSNPTIMAGPEVAFVGETSVSIVWRTDEPSTSVVSYGADSTYGQSESDTTMVFKHGVTITGLTGGTTYHYKVTSANGQNGSVSSTDATFTTNSDQDTSAPKVIRGPAVVFRSSDTATIRWRTDEPSTSKVNYKEGSATSYSSTTETTGYVTVHEVSLTGLTASTKYFYNVSSTDASGNASTQGTDKNFTTKATADTRAPVIIEGPLPVSIGSDNVLVEWKTNEGSTYSFNYGTSKSYGTTITGSISSLRHTVFINGLTPGTDYHYRITSSDGAATPNSGASSDYTFTTSTELDLTGPVFVEGPSLLYTTNDMVIIFWKTDEPADTKVQYGTDASYGSTYYDSEFSKKHFAVVTGLAASQSYVFEISSTDSSGNASSVTSFSNALLLAGKYKAFAPGDTGFTTASAADTTAPVVSSVSVTYTSNTTAIVEWITDEAADSLVSYGDDTSYTSSAVYTEEASDMDTVTNHSVTLTNLSASATYHFSVTSTDPSGNQSTATVDTTFTTTGTADSTAPGVSSGPTVSVSGTTITITWTTDEPSDSQVSYGATSSYGSSVADTEKVTSHSTVITGLTVGDTYHYQVVSNDLSGNAYTSIDLIFVVEAAAADIPTLSEWGMLVFTVLILLIGSVMLRKRGVI